MLRYRFTTLRRELRALRLRIRSRSRSPFRVILHILMFLLSAMVIYSIIKAVSARVLYLQKTNPDGKPFSEVVNELCTMYEKKEIDGRFCPSLCHSEELLRFKSYVENNAILGNIAYLYDCKDECVKGKTVPVFARMKITPISNMFEQMSVAQADMDSRALEMKIKLRVSKHIKKNYVFTENHGVEFDITSFSRTNFLDVLNSYLKAKLGFTPKKKGKSIIDVLSDGHKSLEDKSELPSNFIRTLWALIMQDQYLTFKFYEDLNIFPRIYGACGPLYFYEYFNTEPRLDKRFASDLKPIPWIERVKMALRMLNIVSYTNVHEPPLHLCGMKLAQWGRNLQGQMIYVDGNAVLANPSLNNQLGEPMCSSHEDCSLAECTGWCDKTRGVCLPTRTNNDLQALCHNVLQGVNTTFYMGVLSGQEATAGQKELVQLVKVCAQSQNINSQMMLVHKPDNKVLRALTSSLHVFLAE